MEKEGNWNFFKKHLVKWLKAFITWTLTITL